MRSLSSEAQQVHQAQQQLRMQRACRSAPSCEDVLGGMAEGGGGGYGIISGHNPKPGSLRSLSSRSADAGAQHRQHAQQLQRALEDGAQLTSKRRSDSLPGPSRRSGMLPIVRDAAPVASPLFAEEVERTLALLARLFNASAITLTMDDTKRAYIRLVPETLECTVLEPCTRPARPVHVSAVFDPSENVSACTLIRNNPKSFHRPGTQQGSAGVQGRRRHAGGASGRLGGAADALLCGGAAAGTPRAGGGRAGHLGAGGTRAVGGEARYPGAGEPETLLYGFSWASRHRRHISPKALQGYSWASKHRRRASYQRRSALSWRQVSPKPYFGG